MDPNKSQQLKKKANEAFEKGDYEAAALLFGDAIHFNAFNHILYSNRSATYLKMGNYKLALEDADKSLNLNPKWVKGWLRKGISHYNLKQNDKAIRAFKNGLKHDPENEAIKEELKKAEEKKRIQVGSLGDILKSPGETETFLKLISNPETRKLFKDKQFLERLQIMHENPDMFQMMASQDPKIQKAFQVLNKPCDPNIQDVLDGKAKPAESEQDQRPPSPPRKMKQPQEDPIKKQAQQYKVRGNLAFESKNFQKALQYYDQALNLCPQEIVYFSNKTAVFIQQNRLEEALTQINKAVKIIEAGKEKSLTKIAKVYYRLGCIYAKKSDFDKAIDYFNKSLLKDSNNSTRTALHNAKQEKRLKEQKAYFNPEIALKQFQNAKQHQKAKKFTQAMECLEESIKRNPNVSEYHHRLALVQIKLKLLDKAKISFSSAIKLDPKNIQLYIDQANMHMSVKNYHKAIESFQIGLVCSKNNPICIEGIQKAKKLMYEAPISQQEALERHKRALQDPEIQRIMEEPGVIDCIHQLQRYPQRSKAIFDKNPEMKQKIRILIASGALKINK